MWYQFLNDAELELKKMTWFHGMQNSPGTILEVRTAEDYELDYIIKAGGGSIIIDGKKFVCKPDTIILRRPGQMVYGCGAYESFYLNLNITSSLPVSLPTEINALPPQVYTFFYELFKVYKEANDPLRPFRTRCLLYSVFSEIAAAYREPEQGHSKDILYERVIEYINCHYAQKLTLDKIADNAGISKYALCRIIKEKLGISLFDYIEIIRVNNSCILLIEKETSIKEACYESGFRSMSTFFRSFKKVTGNTPTEYRQSIKEGTAVRMPDLYPDIFTASRRESKMQIERKPLTREEVISVIERKGSASRVPMYYHGWINSRVFGENQTIAEEYLQDYPFDFQMVGVRLPDKYKAPADNPSYRFMHRDPLKDETTNRALDAQTALQMEEIDDMIADFPDADYPALWQADYGEKTKYRVLYWCYWLFERHWWLRGMENALTDYYEYPEETHKLYSALTDFYIKLILNTKKYHDIDGVFITDDIGTQKAPFFSLAIFREFFKPYYAKLIKACHEAGIHVWLHTCGNVTDFVEDFIEIGFDVLHPIQKYSMDEVEIAKKFGGRITILAGLDVQQIIPNGTTEEVRAEVRHIIDTYSRPDGGLILTLGNAATSDCPIENLHAFLDESYEYGKGK
ncbi:MAG: helix-turn-helix domain-containing protein [Clostridia bacterium]|nr:helix-turn-helix domain-containing protein [Clostridia bacterium]